LPLLTVFASFILQREYSQIFRIHFLRAILLRFVSRAMEVKASILCNMKQNNFVHFKRSESLFYLCGIVKTVRC
jgi:hypothetical protein